MNGYHPNGSGPSTNGPSTDQVQIPIGPTNQPRVLIRQLDNMNAVFNLSGVETGLANSLRRVIMADVPTICESTPCSIVPFYPAFSRLRLVHSPQLVHFGRALIYYEISGIHEKQMKRSWWRRERERDGERELMAGIDQVLFTQNTSPIPDEMLAHRLGMVPLISQKVMDGLRYTRVSGSP